MIVVFGGNRIDGDDCGSPRFPSRNVDTVRHKVRTELDEIAPELVVGAAASGADLIVLSEARQRSIPLHIVLPLTIDTFRRRSVVDQGAHWASLFDDLVGSAEGMTVDDLAANDDWYLRGNALIVETAARLADNGNIRGLMVAAPDEQSVSDDLRIRLEAQGWPVKSLDPSAV